MQISILSTSESHPVNKWLEAWKDKQECAHEVSIYRDKSELPGGDLLFLVSCGQLIDAAIRDKYQNSFVLHASDLPKGRGWSPHIWELLDGATYITLSLLSVEDGLDTGAIWAKEKLLVPSDALHDEINSILFSGELRMLDKAIEMVSKGCTPTDQDANVKPTYYRKRTPKDSEIDPNQPLSKLFNKIRLMDPEHYPAFFYLNGHAYTIQLKKISEDGDTHD